MMVFEPPEIHFSQPDNKEIGTVVSNKLNYKV